MILDTCYFVDFQRRPEVVRTISASLSGLWLCTTIITYGELAVGFERPDGPSLRRATLGLPVLGIDEQAAIRFGLINRTLKSIGRRIGDHDSWIAAIALTHQLAVVTRNVGEFSRIDGLQVVGY